MTAATHNPDIARQIAAIVACQGTTQPRERAKSEDEIRWESLQEDAAADRKFERENGRMSDRECDERAERDWDVRWPA